MTDCNGLKISQYKHLACSKRGRSKAEGENILFEEVTNKIIKKIVPKHMMSHQKRWHCKRSKCVELEDRTERDILLHWWHCFPLKIIFAISVVKQPDRGKIALVYIIFLTLLLFSICSYFNSHSSLYTPPIYIHEIHASKPLYFI